MPYDEAIARVASEIERIQATHGTDAFAVLSGASLTTEKTYLMGKFARVCLKTPYIDYNGRLCMVSAGAGNKKAFGIDRAANPVGDMLGTEVIWISGANVAECAPITTNYVWQARENGREDHRRRIRASRRSRAPATCSCRSSRAATSRSSTASCT